MKDIPLSLMLFCKSTENQSIANSDSYSHWSSAHFLSNIIVLNSFSSIIKHLREILIQYTYSKTHINATTFSLIKCKEYYS